MKAVVSAIVSTGLRQRPPDGEPHPRHDPPRAGVTNDSGPNVWLPAGTPTHAPRRLRLLAERTDSVKPVTGSGMEE